jgi:polyhydroxyalkanoate depolymerase
MLYYAYEARRHLLVPLYWTSAIASSALSQVPASVGSTLPVRTSRALAELLTTLQVTHERPAFGIDAVVVDGERVPVRERAVVSTPFATLQHFAKEVGQDQPAVLIVPGLAGHFATLVRGTVETMLPDHDVYVADWHNARDVPAMAGRFGLDEFVEHLIRFLDEIGPGAHLMAVCQPCVPALAATAIMSEDDHPATPSSLVLVAGPVDARVNPGPVNRFAAGQSLERLERTVISSVPWPHPGRGRRVYPGFLQVLGFMGMDPGRHLSAFAGLFSDMAQDRGSPDRTTSFYKEYFAVLDIAAEFYLDTARAVFQDHDLARGQLQWRGRKVNPARIRSALLTIEGEHDEMCPPGQTEAAHALCLGVPASGREHHLQEGVGHYGIFSGTRFRQQVYPRIRGFIAEHHD